MKKTHCYRNISPKDIYIGEVAYINEHTKYYVGDQYNRQPVYYYTGYKKVRYILFTLADKTIKDAKSNEINAVITLKDSMAFDLVSGKAEYPVYGKMDPDLIKDGSMIVNNYHNIGELFKQVCDIKDDHKEVTYEDVLKFVAKLHSYKFDSLDEKIKNAELEETKKSLCELRDIFESVQPNPKKRLRHNFNELTLKVGL